MTGIPASCAAAVSPSALLASCPSKPGNPGLPSRPGSSTSCVVPAVKLSGGACPRRRCGRPRSAAGARSRASPAVLVASGANTSKIGGGAAVATAVAAAGEHRIHLEGPEQPLEAVVAGRLAREVVGLAVAAHAAWRAVGDRAVDRDARRGWWRSWSAIRSRSPAEHLRQVARGVLELHVGGAQAGEVTARARERDPRSGRVRVAAAAGVVVERVCRRRRRRGSVQYLNAEVKSEPPTLPSVVALGRTPGSCCRPSHRCGPDTGPSRSRRSRSTVCEIRTVWSLVSSVPLLVRKLRSAGICSRSDGTFGLSRSEWTLSNCRITTCWTPFPRLHAASALAGAIADRASVPRPNAATTHPSNHPRTPDCARDDIPVDTSTQFAIDRFRPHAETVANLRPGRSGFVSREFSCCVQLVSLHIGERLLEPMVGERLVVERRNLDIAR